MLPDYNTCRKHINAFLGRVKKKPPPPDTVTFQAFWKYKTHLESTGHSILDEDNLQNTASKLRDFLIYFKMGMTGVAKAPRIEDLLRSIKPHYDKIRHVELGSGGVSHYRDQLETIYKKLGGITNNVDYTGSESAIVGKSKTLMAIWGQTPGFDSLTRKRFVKWTHPPEPRTLPHLRSGGIWYEPSQYCDMLVALDDWVYRWSESNNGRIFSKSFSDLCPGLPVGRIIDMIYNWDLPDSRVASAGQQLY